MSVLTSKSLDQLKNQAFNRRRYDGCTSTDDMRIQTGPGRYQLDAPPQYCNACFAPEPTVHQQKWGASLNSKYVKTDVESDLLNLNRPTTRTVCDQYNPETDKVNKSGDVPPTECSFPQTHSRLVDPPCTLRSSGWNRWEWLCENPQEGAMMPFDNLIATRIQQKDQFRPCIPIPIDSTKILPVPSAYEDDMPYDELKTDVVSDIQASVSRAISNYPRGLDTLPAAPSALYGVQPAPVNQPSVALGNYRNVNKL
jgi:hypothetical protein